MKNSTRSTLSNLFAFLTVVLYSYSYAQHEKFEFEFGTSTSLENVLEGNSEEGSTLTWINVNTVKKGWSVNDEGVLVNLGHPIGVVRSEKQYENFILHVEWKHIEPGGNSGIFAWSGANPPADSPLPDGVEIQMLELDWVNINAKDGVQQPIAYVHGEVWGVG
ncbi:MAG TPA: family 16 glycoside hydrolase, partial [Pricia sp.]|nr:family 16 glycoside hydrolase [Pricia sp.]